MHRTGLIVALAIGVVAGLVFGLMPALDLRAAAVFHAVADANGNVFASFITSRSRRVSSCWCPSS